jgi:hypothetical protein
VHTVSEIVTMATKTRYVIWAHREAESLFGPASNPVIRSGALLFFTDRLRASCECDSLNSRSGNPYIRYSIKQARDGGRSRPNIGVSGMSA